MHDNEYKCICYRNVITGELLLHIILLINFIRDWDFVHWIFVRKDFVMDSVN